MWSACIFILGTMTGNQSVLVFVCSFLTYQFLLTTAASPPTPSSPKANTDQHHCCECHSITRTIKVVSQLLGHVFIPDSSSGVPWTQKSGSLCCESQATKGSLFKPGVGQNIGLGALPAAKDSAFLVHSVPWCNRQGWLGIKNQLSLYHSSFNFIFPNPLQAGSGAQLVFRCSVTLTQSVSFEVMLDVNSGSDLLLLIWQPVFHLGVPFEVDWALDVYLLFF